MFGRSIGRFTRFRLAFIVLFALAPAPLACTLTHADEPPTASSRLPSDVVLPAKASILITATATRTPAPTPTPTPTASPTPAITPGPRLTDIHPNELGKIMVLEYHVIGDKEQRWTRTRENFRKDLQYLYSHGYYLIGLNELLDNRVRVPAGKTPVVLSFDDSNRTQFQFIVGPDGAVVPDPKTAIGIVEDFAAQHPDFGKSALFCVLPGADPPNDLFGQKEYRRQKLQYLAQHGYEIGNHTLWHANLSAISEKEIVRQLALATKAVLDLVPGYKINTFDPPFGSYPKDRALMLDGTFQGTSYHHRAVLKVGGGPLTAPNSRQTNYIETPRIQAIQSELDRWFGYFEKHPEERYVSDGDPDLVTFPASLLKDFLLPRGAKEERSPDAVYKVFRLR